MTSIPSSSKVKLFGLDIDALTLTQTVTALCARVAQRPTTVVVTPNVDHIVSLSEVPALRQLYGAADFIVADGMPLVWASRLLGTPLPERVNGTDLFESLCQQAQSNGWRVGALGGMPGQEPVLRAGMAKAYPGMHFEIQSPPMGFDYQSDAAATYVEWANESRLDILFVCLGFPRQDQWGMHHRTKLNVGLVLGVGASMEFVVGLRSRAPVWMQKSGLEWAWRLGSEPAKLWRRYLVRGPRFIGIFWHEWRAKHRQTQR